MDEILQEKMQKIMYQLTKKAARESYQDFLDSLEITLVDYDRIKEEWKIKLGIVPYV
jgi:hypothetical protein